MVRAYDNAGVEISTDDVNAKVNVSAVRMWETDGRWSYRFRGSIKDILVSEPSGEKSLYIFGNFTSRGWSSNPFRETRYSFMAVL